jgi:hypothetical protein
MLGQAATLGKGNMGCNAAITGTRRRCALHLQAGTAGNEAVEKGMLRTSFQATTFAAH